MNFTTLDPNIVFLGCIALILGIAVVAAWAFGRVSDNNRKILESIRDLIPADTLRQAYKDAAADAAKTTATLLDDGLVKIIGSLANLLTGKDITGTGQPQPTTVVAPPDAVVTIEPVASEEV